MKKFFSGWKNEWRTYSIGEKIEQILFLVSILILLKYRIFANTFIDWVLAVIAILYVCIIFTYKIGRFFYTKLKKS